MLDFFHMPVSLTAYQVRTKLTPWGTLMLFKLPEQKNNLSAPVDSFAQSSDYKYVCWPPSMSPTLDETHSDFPEVEDIKPYQRALDG